MGAGIILIAAVIATHFLITAGTEGFVPFAGENNHADAVVITRIRQRLDHLFDRQRAERITHLRAVNGNFGNAVGGFLITNIGVTFGTVLPLNRCVKHAFIGIDHIGSFISRRRIRARAVATATGFSRCALCPAAGMA